MSQDCFICRAMRSFAFTGAGALAGAAVAGLLDAPKTQAAWFALAGGLLTFFAVERRRRMKTHRARRSS